MDAADLILFNVFEAGLWFATALILLIHGRRTHPHAWHFPAAAATFLLFGVSDLVETQTGAWWNPWWLFIWKTACVLSLLGLLVHFRMTRGKHRNPKQNPS